MGLTYAQITLYNNDDIVLANYGHKNPQDIRQVTINALVDTGAFMLCINEDIRQQLGLKTILQQEAQLANGTTTVVDIVGPVELTFLNRSTSCRAMVLPGNTECLLGAIPIEDLDVIIDPRNQTLLLPPDRPYMAQKYLK